MIEKGSDKIFRLNGEILGGIKRARIYKTSSVKKISEYLTDIPVAKYRENEWLITLYADSAGASPFMERDSFETLSVSDGSGTVTYGNCVVKSASQVILPVGAVEYTIRLTAERKDKNG